MSTFSATSVHKYWRGLGLWNFYFIAKLILYGSGHLNFHAFYNLLFASILLMPIPPLWLHRLRHVVAVPVGVALLYYDSWLPPFRRLLEQPEVLQFSGSYLFELLNRFLNWNMIGAGVLLFVACLYLSQWVRVTVLSVAALMLTALPAEVSLQHLVRSQNTSNTTRIDVQAHTASASTVSLNDTPQMSEKTVTEILQEKLGLFYAEEASRITSFDASLAKDQEFDIIFLNICSMSWADLASAQLDQHPLLKKMDLIFDDFNSATSYSGPAVRRLLRSSCGQSSHDALYQDAPPECYLFENLKQLGFETEAILNHDGKFQDFVSDVKDNDSLPQPVVPAALTAKWASFDGSPIWSDYETLNQWWHTRQQQDSPRKVLLYNSITLHDGNREATADGGGRSAPYPVRGQAVLDDLDAFMTRLEESGKRFVVVVIPEHGAALDGDIMQISGMREIPTNAITHVPVGVRLIGQAAGTAPQMHHVSGPSSYLALSEVLARLMREGVFDEESIDWDGLTEGLPQTDPVSENSGTVLMSHSGVPYVRLGERDWIQYRR